MKHVLLLFLMAGLGGAVGHSQTRTDIGALAAQVRDTERAFAKTMADRDHARDAPVAELGNGVIG